MSQAAHPPVNDAPCPALDEVGSTPGTAIPNSVLGKAFSILNAFDDNSDALRLVDLSHRSGVPKPSVYRLAQELVDLGLLEKVDGGYRLGFGVFALSQRVNTAPRLRQVARPVLVDLCSTTNATVHLAVLEGERTYYVEKLGGTHGVHVLSRVGGRLPLTCTASGKLLLALSSRSEQLLSSILDRGLERLTQRSLATPAALVAEVQQIRGRRLATEMEEALAGFKSYAAAIQEPSGEAIAALSVTVPVSFAGDRQLVQSLQAAAATVTRRYASELMGHDVPRRRTLTAV
jgi:DNA-binding IclR family transcriptional regulator